MAEVKWIKMSANIFENRKIKQIECLPDGDAIIVIWVKLLCLAGNINDSGLIYFTKEIPYTEQMLATQFNRPLATIQLALKTFEHFGMIEVIDNMLLISNWEKYQSTDKLLEIREYNRLAKQKSRAKKKLLQGVNDNVNDNVNDMSMTSQPCQGIDIEEEKEEEKKKIKKENKKEGKEKEQCQLIVDMFNSLCPSLNPIITLSDSRKKAIAKGLLTFTMDDFKKCFEMAEHSSFLKGDNPRKWKATFDWLIDDANMGKVIEGNYSSELDDAEADFNAAVERSKKVFAQGKKSSKTAGEDETVKQRMEALKTQFGQ